MSTSINLIWFDGWCFPAAVVNVFTFVTYNKEDSLEFAHYSSDLSCLGQVRDHHKIPEQ
jgi:hypothetical protein